MIEKKAVSMSGLFYAAYCMGNERDDCLVIYRDKIYQGSPLAKVFKSDGRLEWLSKSIAPNLSAEEKMDIGTLVIKLSNKGIINYKSTN